MYKSIYLKIKYYLAVISLILSCLFLQGCLSYQVPNGEDWSKPIQVKKNPVTDTFTVSDIEAKWTLFSYYSASSQPLMVHKVSGDQWIVVMERPNLKPSPKVKIEQINENEFRVLFEKTTK